MSIKTQGTALYIVDTTVSTPALIKFACPTGITGIGSGTQDEIDVTCLDAETRSFVLGLKDGGEVSVPFIFNATANPSHKKIFNMVGDNTEVIVCFSDGTSVPTINSSGMIVAPTGRTSIKFGCAVKQIPFDLATNEVVRSTLPLRVSGDKTLTFKDGTTAVY